MEITKSGEMQRDIESKLVVKMMALELYCYDDKGKMKILDELENLIKKYKWCLNNAN